MTRFHSLFVALIVVFCTYQAGEAQAATYYVDSYSKCKINCGSKANPFQSVEKAREKANLGDHIVFLSKAQHRHTKLSSPNKNVKRLSVSVKYRNR